MTTKLIGVKQFRKDFTSLWREARKKNIKYIVMYHAMPILEILPLQDNQELKVEFERGIAKAMKDVKEGRVYSQDEVFKMFGIK